MNVVKHADQGNILVVDGDEQYRNMLKEWLTTMGHNCFSLADLHEAHDYLRSNSCDLIIFAMQVDGTQLLSRIHKDYRGISVIVILEDGQDHSVGEIIREGACDCLEKPLGKDLFLAKIDYALYVRNLKDNLRAEVNEQQVLINLLNLSIRSNDITELLHDFLACITSFPWLDLDAKGAVFLVDEINSKQLVLKAQHYLAEPLKKICAMVPFGRCLCGKAALLGETVFVSHVDSAHDNRFSGMSDHGHYCVPIKLEGGKLLGVFTLYTKAGVKRREKVDRALAGAASTLARIIKNRYTETIVVEQERRIQAITENAPDAIVLMDESGCVSFWNPAAERLFGYSSEEILGQNLHEIIVPSRYKGKYLPALRKFFSSGHGDVVGGTVELSGLHKSGVEVPVELSLSALNHHGSWQAVGIIRDIKERKKLEKEKDELSSQLRQAQKMEAIGTLAGGIAHDFNNVLGAIIGFADMALDEVPLESQVHKDIDRILTAGNRAKDLVAQILTFSRQKEEEFIPINIQPLLKEAMKFLRASIPRNIKIVVDMVPDGYLVLADPTQIHQIIMNLCTNAYHAMREQGGILKITLENIDYAVESKNITNLKGGKYVKLSVSDTGIGMDSLLLGRIFEPFFTTKPQGEGTGMGLSLVHGIIADHGGVVEVKSKPGEGSVFEVYLPLFDRKKEASNREKSPIIGGNERILLVDDELALTEVSSRKLRKWGYDVTARTSSVEALEAFKAWPEKFDLVITDLAMPNMTGLDMSVEMLKVRPEIPIILSTGFVDQSTIEHAMNIGIKKIISKPVSLHKIAQVIRQLLQGDND